MIASLERMLPLYEAKMIHHYDHRWATYEPDGTTRDVTLAEKQNPEFVVLSRYWVREEVVSDRLGGRWDRDCLLGWRDICRSTDERTMIGSRFPTTAVGHTMPIVLSAHDLRLLQMVWSTFVFDFVARQKVGGTHMTYGYLEQLTTPAPSFTPPWQDRESPCFAVRTEFLQSSASWGLTRGSPFAPRSMRRCSTSTGSSVVTWTTSWRRFRSSGARTRPRTGSTGLNVILEV